MSFKTEVAEIMKTSGKMYEWAENVKLGRTLSAEDREISEVVDAWAKEIGETGNDGDRQIAQLITKTVQDAVYEKPNELIDMMFNRDSVGEFDDVTIDKAPKNTLIAYDSVKGGSVRKSYIDGTNFAPTWKHAQVETELSYVQLRRNGFKTIAQAAVFAKEALEDKKIKDIFNFLDTNIVGGDQLIAVTGGVPTQAAMNQLALYVMDRIDSGDTPFAFGLNKYAQGIAQMTGWSSYMSEKMKDDYNRFGLVKEFQGMLIGGFSGAKKASDGELLVPDRRIFGVAGKVGNITERGDLRVYETMDNDNEKVSLKFTGFEYGYAITNLDKVAKITFTA